MNTELVTKEILNAWFDELSHDNESLERMWFWNGIAAYTHLQSPASDDWKKQHGFKTTEQ